MSRDRDDVLDARAQIVLAARQVRNRNGRSTRPLRMKNINECVAIVRHQGNFPAFLLKAAGFNPRGGI